MRGDDPITNSLAILTRIFRMPVCRINEGTDVEESNVEMQEEAVQEERRRAEYEMSWPARGIVLQPTDARGLLQLADPRVVAWIATDENVEYELRKVIWNWRAVIMRKDARGVWHFHSRYGRGPEEAMSECEQAFQEALAREAAE